MIRTLLLVAAAALTACAPVRQSPKGSADIIVVRRTSYLDSAGVARNMGSVRIAVRSVDRPTEPLGQSTIELFDADSRRIRQGITNMSGIVRFDSIPVALYKAQIRRIGYHGFTMPVAVTAGCVVDVEAYLRIAVIGLTMVPVIVADTSNKKPEFVPAPTPTPPRSTTTVCEAKR